MIGTSKKEQPELRYERHLAPRPSRWRKGVESDNERSQKKAQSEDGAAGAEAPPNTEKQMWVQCSEKGEYAAVMLWLRLP